VLPALNKGPTTTIYKATSTTTTKCTKQQQQQQTPQNPQSNSNKIYKAIHVFSANDMDNK
jgi:hypothetical protein